LLVSVEQHIHRGAQHCWHAKKIEWCTIFT